MHAPRKSRMKIREKWLLLAAVTMLGVLAACSSSNTLQNPPAPASTPVSIVFQPAPPASITQNANAPLTAVVSNDPSNEGVDWTLLCAGNTNCGSLTPLHTASGSPTTFTPSTSGSGNSQSVTIEAFATADHTKNVLTSVGIVGFASNLKGSYVFATQGVDANGGPFQLAGVVTLDGTGAITGGEQTHSDYVLTYSDSISGGSYTIGPDGRGTMTLNTADQNIGQLGVENFAIVYLSNSRVLVETLDDPNLQPSNETSSGTMDLQTSTTAPSGGYAFAVNGTDLALDPLAMGGIINIDSPNTISGAGSVIDQDLAGTLVKKATLSGTTTAPDSFGSLSFTLNVSFNSTPLVFTGYIVDSTHIRLVENDNNGSGAGFGATGGIAISQGSATGTFKNKSSVAGNYVFGILGQDLTGLTTSLASAGTLTADATGKVTSGYNDEYLSGFGDEISDSFTGTYKLDTSGDGRVDTTITFKHNGPGPEFILYLTGNGNPPLVLDADSKIGSVGTGIAYPQAASPIPFKGTYGLYFTQGAFGGENDGTASVAVDQTAGTLSGTVDTNFLLSSLPDTALSGTFGVISATGKATGTMTNTFFPSPGATANTIAVSYYLIDSTQGFFIETDSLNSGELLFGYFAARTPLCQGCP